jgi:hypothetical protein
MAAAPSAQLQLQSSPHAGAFCCKTSLQGASAQSMPACVLFDACCLSHLQSAAPQPAAAATYSPDALCTTGLTHAPASINRS